ncbi:MAG: GTPase [Acidimicrobiia bacterium]
MRDAILSLLDKLDLAVAESVGVVPSRDIEHAARLAAVARQRLAYPDSLVLIGLAGGTGSGKSSLLNALLSEEIALTGGMRPTTRDPLAAIPVSQTDVVKGLLDSLGVDDRRSHGGPDWLCLIDLPDTDSVEPGHRVQVRSLVPLLDGVIWVIDPEKYRDAGLHDLIATAAAHGGQFAFALNQIDRLEPADLEMVIDDLVSALEEDGIRHPRVVSTAASPPAGPPIGIDDLLAAIASMRGELTAAQSKMVVDLVREAAILDDSIGAGSADLGDAWKRGLERAEASIDHGDPGAAAQSVADTIEGLAFQVGGEIGRALTALASDVEGRLLRAIGSASGSSDSTEARFSAEHAEIGTEVRGLLTKRARARASVTDFALAAADLERRLAKLASVADGN